MAGEGVKECSVKNLYSMYNKSTFDLTAVNCQFLDRHLTFPLLEFICGKDLYDQNELLEYILNTANETYMIDYTMDLRKRLNLNQDVPDNLQKRKVEVLAKLKRLQNDVAPIMKVTDLFKSGDNIKDSETFVDALKKHCNFNAEHLQSAYKLAKCLYECGNYQESTSYLYFCLIVMSPNDANYLSVLWGKLAAEILTLNWNTALEDLMRLQEFIDGANFTNIKALHQRSWLIHWSVLVFFNHRKGRDLLIEMFLYKPLYLNAIQTTCPHIMRYLATAVIINRSRRNALKDLIAIIEQESYTYSDPITDFLECVYVNFDFEAARLKLHDCQTVILNDFFIFACLDEFVENARLMIFEIFCRIHQRISIDMLAEKLNMTSGDAEKWIVNLICNANLNAKIDSKMGLVVMDTQPINHYQQLVERIDSLSVRSEHLKDLLERKSKLPQQETVDNWKYY